MCEIKGIEGVRETPEVISGSANASNLGLTPGPKGEKSVQHGQHSKAGTAMAGEPLELVFTTVEEGYYRLAARLDQGQQPAKGYLKVEYEAPASSGKF